MLFLRNKNHIMDSSMLLMNWNNHNDNLLKNLLKFRNKTLFTDVTLVCDSNFYHAHRNVLSSCSEYFIDLFHKIQSTCPVVVLKDIRSVDIEALLTYMYLGKIEIKRKDLPEFFKAAEFLRIKGIVAEKVNSTLSENLDLCKKIITKEIKNEIETFSNESLHENMTENSSVDINNINTNEKELCSISLSEKETPKVFLKHIPSSMRKILILPKNFNVSRTNKEKRKMNDEEEEIGIAPKKICKASSKENIKYDSDTDDNIEETPVDTIVQGKCPNDEIEKCFTLENDNSISEQLPISNEDGYLRKDSKKLCEEQSLKSTNITKSEVNIEDSIEVIQISEIGAENPFIYSNSVKNGEKYQTESVEPAFKEEKLTKLEIIEVIVGQNVRKNYIKDSYVYRKDKVRNKKSYYKCFLANDKNTRCKGKLTGQSFYGEEYGKETEGHQHPPDMNLIWSLKINQNCSKRALKEKDFENIICEETAKYPECQVDKKDLHYRMKRAFKFAKEQ